MTMTMKTSRLDKAIAHLDRKARFWGALQREVDGCVCELSYAGGRVMARYWEVARKLHRAGGSSSGALATEPIWVDDQVPQLRRGRRVMRCCCVGPRGRGDARIG